MTPINEKIFYSYEARNFAIYPNNFKKWKIGKEAPQNFRSEQATIAERQGASKNENYEAKPSQPKTDSSSCLGIKPDSFAKRICQAVSSFFVRPRSEIREVRFRRTDELYFDPTLPPDPVQIQTFYSAAAPEFPKRMLPGIPNGGNTCFFAALTQAFFGGDQALFEAAKRGAESARGKEKAALSIVSNYLGLYKESENSGRSIPVEKTREIRNALALLGMEGAERPIQQDADETALAVMSAMIEKTGRFRTRLWTLDTLGAPIPGAALQGTDERVLDPARRIFWEPPQTSWGRIDLSIAKEKDFAAMVRDYFFEDKSKERPRETLLRQDSRGIKRRFPFQSKRMCFESAPERICVTFKRFQGLSKIEQPIRGLRDLMILPGDYFLDGKAARYRLDGAVFHHGKQLGSGHYTAFRRRVDGPFHRFYSADDGRVEPLSQKSYLDRLPESYMVFFKKIY